MLNRLKIESEIQKYIETLRKDFKMKKNMYHMYLHFLLPKVLCQTIKACRGTKKRLQNRRVQLQFLK